MNYLDPSIKKGKWTDDEDIKLIDLHLVIGNKWAHIQKFMNGRTEDSIKQRFKLLSKFNNSKDYKDFIRKRDEKILL